MKKYLNEDGVLGYPAAMKELPFCCWRYETQNGRRTKVPYNAKTGAKAKTDAPTTFCSMEEALKAVGSYSGIGFNIDKDSPIGCIDLDHCNTDGVLSDSAQSVLELLPGALAEVSPSETGLHLFFLVPAGFSFDADAYYINNRKKGMEIYLPREKAHFMTLTGAVYRGGDMVVTVGQLMAFLDTYMKRRIAMAPVALPAGGSILTDEQVIQKIAAEPDPKFIEMYNGNWESYGEGPNWSQSDADMTVLMKLAFYCRGDMEQMDRLFRQSGLMRDKWDRALGDSTYGVFSMTNAINHCSAFYEPPVHSSTEDDFGYAALIDSLLEESLTTETATAEDTLEAAAWAYQNDLQRYSLLRQAIPKSVGIRNFERAVKQHITTEAPSVSFLNLKGVSTPGMTVPPGWTVDDHGISHLELAFGEYKPVPVSSEPLFISAKMVNVDDGTEKLEITFRRNGSYKTLIAPRSDMLNKNSIIHYADSGLPVSSGTAGNLTKFIAEMEAANNRVIPLKRCIRRAGWVGGTGIARKIEFFPYYLHSPMTGQEDEENAERFLEHLKTEGDEGVWLDMVAKVRTMPFARAMLAASFASPLLYPLQHRNIYYHSWFDSKSGKTAALKLAMSVWGDPQALVKSYFSTMVGMEHRAGTMKHLPLALDELQTLEKRMDVNNMVYTLGNGVGKTRGRAGGGIRAIDDWKNCILSTGEQPISTDNSMDGINTRLLEVYAAPVPDQNLAMQMHQVAERNYGFAGEKFIRWLIPTVIEGGSSGHSENSDHGDQEENGRSGGDDHSGGSLKTDYETMRTALDMIFGDRYVGAENIAVIALADYYASIAVFGLEREAAFGEALDLGAAIMDARKQEDHTDTVDRAWTFVTGWVAANKSKFGGSLYSPSEYFGATEGGKLYVIATTLNDALEEAGFSYKKCIRGFAQRGYIGTIPDSDGKRRTQLVKRVNGVNTRVYQLNVAVEEDEAEPLFAD